MKQLCLRNSRVLNFFWSRSPCPDSFFLWMSVVCCQRFQHIYDPLWCASVLFQLSFVYLPLCAVCWALPLSFEPRKRLFKLWFLWHLSCSCWELVYTHTHTHEASNPTAVAAANQHKSVEEATPPTQNFCPGWIFRRFSLATVYCLGCSGPTVWVTNNPQGDGSPKPLPLQDPQEYLVFTASTKSVR